MNGIIYCPTGITRPLPAAFDRPEVNWTYVDAMMGIPEGGIPPNSVNYILLQCISNLSLEQLIPLLSSLSSTLVPGGKLYTNTLVVVLAKHLQRIAFEQGGLGQGGQGGRGVAEMTSELMSEPVIRGQIQRILQLTGFSTYQLRHINDENYIVLIK